MRFADSRHARVFQSPHRALLCSDIKVGQSVLIARVLPSLEKMLRITYVGAEDTPDACANVSTLRTRKEPPSLIHAAGFQGRIHIQLLARIGAAGRIEISCIQARHEIPSRDSLQRRVMDAVPGPRRQRLFASPLSTSSLPVIAVGRQRNQAKQAACAPAAPGAIARVVISSRRSSS